MHYCSPDTTISPWRAIPGNSLTIMVRQGGVCVVECCGWVSGGVRALHRDIYITQYYHSILSIRTFNNLIYVQQWSCSFFYLLRQNTKSWFAQPPPDGKGNSSTTNTGDDDDGVYLEGSNFYSDNNSEVYCLRKLPIGCYQLVESRNNRDWVRSNIWSPWTAENQI